ncbi:cytochrome P450 (plasmid) [Streptomyces sp. NBC_00190]|uniref:cytochrome P450 family protein n=1 Tax=unclassified Streptomyces TaxID=2593676 RepID=UPI002E2B00E3|nr:cytochrome P450 [Streptomyces sp. NBC_00190]
MLRQCPFAIDPSGRDIHAEAARLRELGPAVRVTLPGGVQGWAVAGHHALRKLLADPRVSKDAYRHWPAWISGEVGPEWPLAIWVSVQNMITAHGAEHTRLRRMALKAFTLRRVAAMRPRIDEVVAEVLDELARRSGDEPVDLRAHFAHEVPTRIMFELFGIPEWARARLYKIISGFFDTAISAEDAHRNGVDLYETMGELVSHKRAHPAEDLTSGLIAARDDEDGAQLTEKELVDNLILLFTAGYETSVNLISSAVHELLAHPSQLELIRSGLASWEDAVEETLRRQPPAANAILRYAVEDIDVEGTVIPKGDPIIVSLASAGRDPQVHGADADDFDITRATRSDHMAFGFGPHYCMGATLSRLEAAVAVSALFGRFPGMSLAVPPQGLGRVESFISNGLRELPVRLGPDTVQESEVQHS